MINANAVSGAYQLSDQINLSRLELGPILSRKKWIAGGAGYRVDVDILFYLNDVFACRSPIATRLEETKTALHSINEFASLGENWDGYGALLPLGVGGRITTVHARTLDSNGRHLPSSPSRSIRAGIWRCATPRAPRQLPSLTPPDREIQTPEANSRVDKTWGQGQVISTFGTGMARWIAFITRSM